jgi:muramoyltetrapeptide carboxypeptidase
MASRSSRPSASSRRSFRTWGRRRITSRAPTTHRAADLNAAFADTSVDAIFCLHGGYGASRILPLLDYETIRKNPKVICGYSDITALLNAIHRLTGLVTFHGPVGSEAQTDYTLAEFRRSS